MIRFLISRVYLQTTTCIDKFGVAHFCTVRDCSGPTNERSRFLMWNNPVEEYHVGFLEVERRINNEQCMYQRQFQLCEFQDLMATTMTPLKHQMFKSQILRTNREIWRRASENAKPRRQLTHLPLLSLPHRLHLSPHSLPIHHRNLLSNPPLPPLLRSRSHPLSSPMSSLKTPDSKPTTKTVRIVVKGRVQGVFYRDWTVENATELGLKGWVRNRRDGSVEALFCGSPDKVQEVEQRCRRGPPVATVTGLEVSPCGDDPGTGFERRPTV